MGLSSLNGLKSSACEKFTGVYLGEEINWSMEWSFHLSINQSNDGSNQISFKKTNQINQASNLSWLEPNDMGELAYVCKRI